MIPTDPALRAPARALDQPAPQLTLSQRGRLGARAHWDNDAVYRGIPTGPRVVRLDTLPTATQAIIRALLAANAAAEAASGPEQS